MSRWRLPPSATLRICNPLQIAKIGSPRSIACLIASSSQRSRSGFISFSITDGSGTGWFKNSGATSGPPVSNNPSICSKGTLRFAAFQTLRPGYFAKNGSKYFSSERRIQVARLRMPQTAVIPSEVENPVAQAQRKRRGIPRLPLRMTVLMLTPENNEDPGEKGDDSWNNAKVEPKRSNQADKDEIDRQQKHSDVFVKGHGLIIWESRVL